MSGPAECACDLINMMFILYIFPMGCRGSGKIHYTTYLLIVIAKNTMIFEYPCLKIHMRMKASLLEGSASRPGIFYKYSDEQKMTEFGRSSISDDFSNFSLSSEFPITLAA